MRDKILLGFILASMATSGFALEIYKGHVVSHKEWTTGNAKGFFKPGKITSEILKSKGLRTDNSYSSLYTYATTVKGNVNTPIDIPGDNYIFVYNDTQVSEFYHYTFSICARNSEHTASCAFYYDELVLEPGGYASSAEQPILQVSFAKPGLYESAVSTMLYKELESSRTNSGSTSEATIEIS